MSNKSNPDSGFPKSESKCKSSKAPAKCKQETPKTSDGGFIQYILSYFPLSKKTEFEVSEDKKCVQKIRSESDQSYSKTETKNSKSVCKLPKTKTSKTSCKDTPSDKKKSDIIKPAACPTLSNNSELNQDTNKSEIKMDHEFAQCRCDDPPFDCEQALANLEEEEFCQARLQHQREHLQYEQQQQELQQQQQLQSQQQPPQQQLSPQQPLQQQPQQQSQPPQQNPQQQSQPPQQNPQQQPQPPQQNLQQQSQPPQQNSQQPIPQQPNPQQPYQQQPKPQQPYLQQPNQQQPYPQLPNPQQPNQQQPNTQQPNPQQQYPQQPNQQQPNPQQPNPQQPYPQQTYPQQPYPQQLYPQQQYPQQQYPQQQYPQQQYSQQQYQQQTTVSRKRSQPIVAPTRNTNLNNKASIESTFVKVQSDKKCLKKVKDNQIRMYAMSDKERRDMTFVRPDKLKHPKSSSLTITQGSSLSKTCMRKVISKINEEFKKNEDKLQTNLVKSEMTNAVIANEKSDKTDSKHSLADKKKSVGDKDKSQVSIGADKKNKLDRVHSSTDKKSSQVSLNADKKSAEVTSSAVKKKG